MGFLAGLFGSSFLKYLGGFTLVMVLLIILASLVGGITYDTSDRSWGGWDFSITFNFGEFMQNLRERREEKQGRRFFFNRRQQTEPQPYIEPEDPKFDIPDSRRRPLLRPFKRLFEWMRIEPRAGHDNQVPPLLGSFPKVPSLEWAPFSFSC